MATYFIYLPLYLYTYKTVLYKYLPVYDSLEEEYGEKYSVFFRSGRNHINKFSMLLCGLTLTPIRICGYILMMIIHWLILRILWIGADIEKPLSGCRSFFIRRVNNWGSRISFFCIGFHWISFDKKKIQDVLPEYPP